MKRRLVYILSAAALLTSSVALADPMTIDLDAMTPVEIKEIIEMAEAEYEEATDFPSSDSRLLTENFETAFESLIPSDAEASYPLFGLSKQRARSMYMLSGECTVKFADKTRSSYDMTMIYWHEVETKTFHQVAFYSTEKVYYCDNDLLKNVAPYLSETILQTLGADEIVYHATSTQETSVPTPTVTPAPTAATQEAYIEAVLKDVLGDRFIRFEKNNQGNNINVYFGLRSGWSNESTRNSFFSDCAGIAEQLSALSNAGKINYSNLYIQADTDFVDNYGNQTTSKAMTLDITSDDIAKINWDRFNYKNIESIGYVWCHQSLHD